MIVWDTSALMAAVDTREPGHAWARNILQRGDEHGGSLLLRAELFGLIVGRGQSKPGRIAPLLAGIEPYWAAFTLLPVDLAEVGRAEHLIRRYALRGADALLLSAALWFASKAGRRNVRFVSGDADQVVAARREGLRVIELKR